MKNIIITVYFFLLVTLLLSPSAFAKQKLAYDVDSKEIAPRSGAVTIVKPVSAEITKARQNTTLAPHLQFNRLHKPEPAPQLSPTADGLHDAALPSVQNELLPPLAGMTGLTKDSFGNRVNWVKAVNNKEIMPIGKISEDDDDMMILNIDIVIPAVGWTPDVIFPHKAHTQWLGCSNCHEAQTDKKPFFEPVAGENPMTMNEVVEGKWCGWCHSAKTEKVAFPISDCARCHSGPIKKKATPLKPYMIK
ncbi:MAG: hypothetical protein OEV42_20860 [Deltaproteobacteria bacterium]|nr:hypothetical protein [Deltaproteobacteria bacterium]